MVADLARRVEVLELATNPEARLLAALPHGSVCFSAAEVLRHSRIDGRLRDVLQALGLHEERAIGDAFRRVRDRVIDGCVLRREGRDAGGSIWCVYVVGHKHAAARFPMGGGAQSSNGAIDDPDQ